MPAQKPKKAPVKLDLRVFENAARQDSAHYLCRWLHEKIDGVWQWDDVAQIFHSERDLTAARALCGTLRRIGINSHIEPDESGTRYRLEIEASEAAKLPAALKRNPNALHQASNSRPPGARR